LFRLPCNVYALPVAVAANGGGTLQRKFPIVTQERSSSTSDHKYDFEGPYDLITHNLILKW
jgi:hypothetical protein